MKPEHSLDLLESEVLARMVAHRQAQKSLRALPVALLVCISALAGGWLTGMSEPRRHAASRGSESALLADDMRLAPSSLLASNQ